MWQGLQLSNEKIRAMPVDTLKMLIQTILQDLRNRLANLPSDSTPGASNALGSAVSAAFSFLNRWCVLCLLHNLYHSTHAQLCLQYLSLPCQKEPSAVFPALRCAQPMSCIRHRSYTQNAASSDLANSHARAAIWLSRSGIVKLSSTFLALPAAPAPVVVAAGRTRAPYRCQESKSLRLRQLWTPLTKRLMRLRRRGRTQQMPSRAAEAGVAASWRTCERSCRCGRQLLHELSAKRNGLRCCMRGGCTSALVSSACELRVWQRSCTLECTCHRVTGPRLRCHMSANARAGQHTD